MRFAAATTAAGLAAVASAQGHYGHGGPGQYGPPAGNGTGPASYVTSVVTAYTTYCPSATEITHGASTYTVTEATTLTISDCPCTVTMPVYSSTVSVCTTCSAPPVYSSSSPAAPVTPTPYTSSSVPVAPYPSGNSTTVAPTGSYSASSTSASATTPVAYTGAAIAKAVPAGLLAVLGLVAAL